MEPEWGACLQILMGHSGHVNSVAFPSDGSCIASASGDYTIKIWDARSGACLQTLNAYSHSVALSPDEICVSSDVYCDNAIKIWDASRASDACLKTLEGHSKWITSVVLFSEPDGTCFASTSVDGTIKTWDAGSGACIQTLVGHSKRTTSVSLSYESTYIASGSWDTTIKIWDASSDTCVQTLECQGQPVRFDTATSCFHTEMGILPWNGTSNYTLDTDNTSICGIAQHQTYGLTNYWAWIIWNYRKMLWVPLEYRPASLEYRVPSASYTANTSNIMVIGGQSGRILALNFSDEAPL